MSKQKSYQKFYIIVALSILIFAFTATITYATLTLNSTTITSSGDLLLTPTGNVGIGTITPTNLLSLGNAAARKFWIENSATDVVGRALTVAAGGTVAGTSVSDVTGGNLILQSGLGTGTGASTISFQTGTTLTTGTTLQTMSTKMTILGSGNVGIGTSVPTEELEIASSGVGSQAIEDLSTYNTGSGSDSTLRLFKSNSNTLSTLSTTQSGDRLGSIFFTGVGLSNTKITTAVIRGFQTGTAGATVIPSALVFYTSDATSVFERLRIDQNGNVGIGTASPRAGSKLEVAGIIQTDAQTTDPGCTATADIGKFWFDNTTTTTAVKVCKSVAGVVGWSTVTTTP